MIVRSRTIHNARSAAASLQAEVEAGKGIIVDCSVVEQADITFVQTLMGASRSCAARDLPFSMAGMSDAALSAFQRAGVTPPGAMPSEQSGN